MTAVDFTHNSFEVFDPWLDTYHWAPTTLTFSFPNSGSFYSYQGTNAVRVLDPAQQNAVRKALEDISSFTNMSFVEITETFSQEATLRFAEEVGLDGGYAYLPESDELAGDAFFGAGTDNPVAGNEAYLYFIHEIGHAMGLNHGHEYPTFVNSGLDSQEYTVLTYTDYVGDTDTFSYDSGPIDWAQSYQQLDIQALQFLYGTNYSATGEIWSGDTVYGFNPNTGEMSINGVGQGTPAGNRIFRTIWDGHGNDTYDLSSYSTDLDIDLGPGEFSTFSQAQLADLDRFSTLPSRIAEGNVANARVWGSDTRGLIENAIGGSGDDVIAGNNVSNVLRGRSGDDTLDGLSGSDTLFGGGGRDELIGGSHDDTLKGGGAKDVLKGGNGNDRLVGGGGNDKLKGGDKGDILIGGDGFDRLTGGSGKDDFVFSQISHSAVGAKADRILDFEVGLDDIDLSALGGGNLTLVLGGPLSGNGPSVATRNQGNDTLIEVDTNGNGSANMEILVVGVQGLGANDFLL